MPNELPIYMTSKQIDRILECLRNTGENTEDKFELEIAEEIVRQYTRPRPVGCDQFGNNLAYIPGQVFYAPKDL